VSDRDFLLREWLNTVLPITQIRIAIASKDASFRQYFRVWYNGKTGIVMDAPPDKEDCRSFLIISRAMRRLGLNTPEILAENIEHGFLLMTDFGNRQYLGELNKKSVHYLYADALEALFRLQVGGDPDTSILSTYDAELLYLEMELFRSWFLERQVGLDLSDDEHHALDNTFAILAGNAVAQPRVWVHRDYHSRNLMITTSNNPGVLDFQDAMIGAVTYDLVSLLRDCYISWPRKQVVSWILDYRARLHAFGMHGLDDSELFLRWFDLMGIQRHLKAIGIFSRLNLRDGKPRYLLDIPRTLGYLLETSSRYTELANFHKMLLERRLHLWEFL
jgi:N-acetylmuramate 1-kinase